MEIPCKNYRKLKYKKHFLKKSHKSSVTFAPPAKDSTLPRHSSSADNPSEAIIPLNMPKSTSTAQTVGSSLSFTEKMCAGAIARGVAQTVLHPVDVVRTRLQARGVSQSFRPSVFIKGVIPQISLAIPAGAIQFVAFEAAKEQLARLLPDERLSQTRALLAGAFGALAAASCRIPQEVLKQRIQADIYPNIGAALRGTLANGPAGLYTGWLATISRDVPWNALSFMFHAQGKRIFSDIKGRAPAPDENLAIAGTAGAVAAIIMTPIDVVKTRIMTSKVAAGIIPTLQTILREEGAATLMKGVIPRILFLAPLAGITFSVYEAVAANMRSRKMDAASNGKTALRLPRSMPNGMAMDRQLALRFSKVAVRLARNDSAPMLGDLPGPTRYVFSLAA